MASRAIFQHETGGHPIIDTAEAVRRPRMRKSRMREKAGRAKKYGAEKSAAMAKTHRRAFPMPAG
jgi:hypothetical protein